jgi:glutathione S-transferase
MISNVVIHTPSVRVTWLLRELDIEFVVQDVKQLMVPGGVLSPEEEKLNPKHAAPLLEYTYLNNPEKRYMFESSGILRFVATHSSYFKRVPKGRSLMRRQPMANSDDSGEPKELIPTLHNCPQFEEIREFEQWFAFASSQLNDALQQIQILYEFRHNKKGEHRILELYVDKWNIEMLPQLEKRFEKDSAEDEFFLKEFGFSVLDIILGHVLHWAARYDFLEPFSQTLQRYFVRLCSREGFVRSIQDRGALNPRMTF